MLPQSKPVGGEDVAGVVRRGRHVGQVRLLAGGQVQLGGGPVELVADVVVAVRAAAVAVGSGRRSTAGLALAAAYAVRAAVSARPANAAS